VKLFLRDLLTASERIMLGRRVIIARMIIAGEHNREIARRLRVGQATIHRVKRWLSDQLPGYEQAIKEMEKEFVLRQERYEKNKLYATSSLYRLKKKYPLHFLFFPTPKLKGEKPSYGMYPRR